MDNLEQWQKSFEDEMKSSTSVTSSSSTCTPDVKSRIQGRLTATLLQVKYILYVQACGYNLYLNSLFSRIR